MFKYTRIGSIEFTNMRKFQNCNHVFEINIIVEKLNKNTHIIL